MFMLQINVSTVFCACLYYYFYTIQSVLVRSLASGWYQMWLSSEFQTPTGVQRGPALTVNLPAACHMVVTGGVFGSLMHSLGLIKLRLSFDTYTSFSIC